MKKYTVFLIVLSVLLLGFFTGTYLYKASKKDNGKDKIAELVNDECTYLGEARYKDSFISVNSQEEKTSPNCTIILKIYYTKCGHLVETKKVIEEAEINLTEEELKQKFKDWELQKFTPTEIVLYKETDEFCGEHYVLKEKDGNIAIFSINEDSKETLVEITDIATNYLEDEDLEKIRNGIYVNSKKELNKVLEDFE